MRKRFLELVAALDDFGYLKFEDEHIEFNKKKIDKKLDEIGAIVLHEYVYNNFAREELLVEGLVMRSVCTTPEEFRKFIGTKKLGELDEGIKSKYIERYALIEIFYNIDKPEYKDGFYHFTANYQRAFTLIQKLKGISIKESKLNNIKAHFLN